MSWRNPRRCMIVRRRVPHVIKIVVIVISMSGSAVIIRTVAVVIGGNRGPDGSANRAAHDRTVPATDFIADCRASGSAYSAANRRIHRRTVCLSCTSGQ